MRAVLVAICLLASGCFTSWVAVQAGGRPQVLDEGARNTSVPMPGVRESVAIKVWSSPRLDVQCTALQTGTDRVYHTGTRYGGGWKKWTALAFVIEGALAASLYFLAEDKPDNKLAGIIVGADALGTAAIFFAPKKHVASTETKLVETTLHMDCPEGLELAIGDATYPVDANGKLDEAAHAAWETHTGQVAVVFAGNHRPLVLGGGVQFAEVRIEVPLGTLTGLANL